MSDKEGRRKELKEKIQNLKNKIKEMKCKVKLNITLIFIHGKTINEDKIKILEENLDKIEGAIDKLIEEDIIEYKLNMIEDTIEDIEKQNQHNHCNHINQNHQNQLMVSQKPIKSSGQVFFYY